MDSSTGPVLEMRSTDNSGEGRPDHARDAETVAALDVAFQRAVKENDTARIDEILHPTFALVLGDGRMVSREETLEEATSGRFTYEVQDEDPGTQVVRIWRDTAVVTARLRIRGSDDHNSFSRTLWFSDTYVRTEDGWKYAFGQASLPLECCG